MNERDFVQVRQAFRHALIEKSHGEILAHRNIFKIVSEMTPRQIQHLLDDMSLMLDYKAKDHSTREAWESIERGWQKS